MTRARDEKTLSLFDAPVPDGPGSLSYGLELRHTLNESIKRWGHDRYELATGMSRLLDTDVTKTQIDSWTAESREGWRFPFEYAAAFEAVTGTHALSELLAAKRGCRLLVGDDAIYAELGRLEREEELLKARKRELRELARRRR